MREQFRRSAGHPEAGMTIVEVVAAMVILGILSVVVLGIILQTQQASVDNRSRIAAANLAAREIDIVREEFGRSKTAPIDIANAGTVVNPHQLAGGIDGQPLVLDGKAYTVERSVHWNITGDGESACDGGELVLYPTLGIIVSVTWPNMNGTQPVTAEAAIAPDKGSGMPTSASFVVVEVVDSAGQPNPGRSVTVTGDSEVRSGVTDATGCAVVQVNPATAGTAYNAALGDSGYVDISGATAPSKYAGSLIPGKLGEVVKFAYDRAATLEVHVVDPDGNPVADDEVAGSSVTLVQFGSSGASDELPVILAGADTSIGGLWPTTYGAYFGETPLGSYQTVDLDAGGTGSLDVVLTMATGVMTNLPSGTTSIVAVPGAGACTDPGARTIAVGPPATFELVPSTWSFYASGPAFDCAAGPSGVLLGAGDNDELPWETTSLRVTGAPTEGTLWAVSKSKVPGPLLTTCPGPSYAGIAVDVSGARTAPVAIPAGDWYVYRLAADGACLGIPIGHYSQQVGYGATTSIPWNETYTTVGVTVKMPATETLPLNSSYRVIAATTANLNCTSGSLPSGAVAMTTTSTTQAVGNLSAGSWRFYRQRTSGGSGNRCTAETGNPQRSFPGASPTYTLTWNSGVTAP